MPTLGILVGGGPAPGINGVIGAAAIEAINEGCSVIGIYDGYRWLARGDAAHATSLRIEDVSRIHWTGGSILRTARTNPAQDEKTLTNCVNALRELGITHLLCIGGDDTTFGAAKIAEATGGSIRVATVPKTIDNDLPLPDNMPTFGFETARAVGAGIVETLMEDARTTQRWYLVISMGRKSGALAVGIAKAAGATLAVIPEQFASTPASLDLVANVIVGSMIKRSASGADHGVAVIAEGIAERLDERELTGLKDVERDPYGHVRLADIDLGAIIKSTVMARLKDLRLNIGVVTKDVGYELRCAKPVPFDVEYTRTLGYGAVRYLLGGGSGAMVALRGGHVAPVPLAEMIDPQTGRIRVRVLDTRSEAYEVCRKYSIRLEPADLEEPRLGPIAAKVGLTPTEFARRFSAASKVL
ncbi:MAG TPA: diphosphate--fructose-6-phosphate 1-phosphotransferase [Candidatus Eremiobacteraceae bacterium]|nr:diphosphate--fructose-6-phosphate 1-phosphotransferase [Candidatus Eremiobacteraceae bacterium]